MKLKDGFLLRQVGDNHVVVPVGARTVDFRCILTLNETGAFLWERMGEDCTADQLTAALLSEYAVEPSVAAADVDAFVNALREKGLLDE
ncbi:MAG: PqqD family protein [Clostridia bacterium]|nr:PqqD family protein [Clostridia bacterium]